MPTSTDLNKKPYFDDFDETKNFHRILFNPHLAVQARELTQLQTILQNQIERFGDNILREGTIVTGGNFVEESNLNYVKLQDVDSLGSSFNIFSFDGLIARGAVSGLTATIVSVAAGLESQFPDLNTLWIKYKDTVADKKVFDDGEDIEIVDANDIVVATVVAAFNNATGKAYGVRCGDGIIFQKGNFIRFEDGLTIVSKYDDQPDGVVVGFETKEEIVNSYQDESLLDNANSFNNYNAPGADRLKLVPVLTTKTLAEAQADESFFALQEYSRGKLIRRKLDTFYSKVGDMLARRTHEESGNYVVRGFDPDVQRSTSNTSLIELTVGPGVGYVNGRRHETTGQVVIETDAGTDTGTETNQIVSTNFGSYLIVNNLTGTFEFERLEQVNLIDATSLTIGTARVRSVTNHDSFLTHRLYLVDVQMNPGQSFGDVRIIDNGVDSAIVVLGSSGKAVLQEVSLKRAVFPVGRSHLSTFNSGLTEYTYRTKTVPGQAQITAGGSVSISLTGNAEFPYGAGTTLSNDQLRDIVIVSKTADATYPLDQPIDLTTATAQTDGTGKILTINLGTPPAGGAVDCIIYHNVYQTNTLPTGKTLTDFTVTWNITTNAFGPFSLGVPDAYQIDSVIRNGVDDITDQFELINGQRDTFYGLSSVINKGGAALVNGDTIDIQFKAFRKVITGGYQQSFFTVDSYTDVAIENIPTYTMEDGSRIFLRDAIDFRPYVQETLGGLTGTDPSSVETFSNDVLNFPAPNSFVSATFDYYLGRYDNVIVDDTGVFSIVRGESAENPVRPAESYDSMTLATFYIPPYPALPAREANRLKKSDYSVRFNKKNNKRYTMKDIRSIDRRVQNIEYYNAISLLEVEAKDMVVQDANGLNKFKNGIFVDSFANLKLADIADKQYSASIDLGEKSISAKFTAFPIDLLVTQTTGTTNHGETLTLESNTSLVVIDQPFATAVKNCTTNFYKFTGSMELSPSDDSAPDVTTAPDVNIDIDMTTPFAEFTEQLSQFVPLQRDSSSTSTATTTQGRTRTTTTTTEVTSTSLEVSQGSEETASVGDFVSDVSVNPYLRTKEVKVEVSGLRPNTRVYAYFDAQDVSAHVSPAMLNGTEIVQSGTPGQELRTDAVGKLYAIFTIPEDTFRVGDRKLEVFDAPTYNSADAMTCYASHIYSGFNFSFEKTGLTTTTRTPDTQALTSTSVSTSSTSSTIRIQRDDSDSDDRRSEPEGERGVDWDPLLQSFIIDPNVSTNASAYVSGVNLFFATKSDTVGATVMLREMENGHPTSAVIPFSKVHLDVADIVTSTDGSLPTTVTFKSPIQLKTGVEYAVCIMPDGSNPDFTVYISRVGETDLISGTSVTHDTNSGMLFTSTNNRTWTPYQNENLKYQLLGAEFSQSSGTATLTPSNMEFLTLDSISGKFQQGEKVYIDNSATPGTGTIELQAGNTVVQGTTTTFTTELVSGDWMVATPTEGDQLIRVTENGIDTDSQIRLINVPTVTPAVTALPWFKTTVATVEQFTDFDSNKLVLKDSSAKVGSVFAAGTTIVGASSGARANITTVDDQKISWIQPNIRRSNQVGTRSTLYGDLSIGGTTNRVHLPFNKQTQLNAGGNEYVIPSTSSVVAGAVNSSFEIVLESATTDNASSPLIDHEASTLIGYEYIINNDSTNEETNNGSALSKYVSKPVSLASGMDAEDLRVYLSAYRPTQTNIKVYAKFVSQTDSRSPIDIGWTELSLKAETNQYSSSSDRDDFREFEFDLPAVDSGNPDSAFFDGTVFGYTDPGGVVYTNFKYFTIKIVMLSDTYSKAPRVKDLRTIALT